MSTQATNSCEYARPLAVIFPWFDPANGGFRFARSSSPKPETRGILRSQSTTMFNEAGGIGSALSQYDTTRKYRPGNLLEQRPLNVVFKEMPTRSLAVSPMSLGMPFSLERRSERLLKPSTMSKLSIPPDQLGDNFRPIDSRKHSFHSHHNVSTELMHVLGISARRSDRPSLQESKQTLFTRTRASDSGHGWAGWIGWSKAFVPRTHEE